MTFSIQRNFFKQDKYSPGQGWGWNYGSENNPNWQPYRPEKRSPNHIIIHTTSAAEDNTPWEGELEYIRDSLDVSAHAYVGREGQIEEVIDPMNVAWHAGATIPGFSNLDSIGIEHHVSQSGYGWTPAMKAASDWLVRYYMAKYNIMDITHISTHRRVALPAGRKQDPAGWDDTTFYTWREGLLATPLNAPLTNSPTQIIGVKPSITLGQFQSSIQRGGQPMTPAEAERVYTFASWLDIDPAAFLGMWSMEGGLPYGSSPLQALTHCPLNMRSTADMNDPIYTSATGSTWRKYETFQLGSFSCLMHLKNYYGAAGHLTLEDIIPIYAPASDGNNPASYIKDVKTTMKYIKEH